MPPGFVITTAAYDLLLKKDYSHIRELLASFEIDKKYSADIVSGKIRGLIANSIIPQQIIDEIIKAYRLMKSPAVAVRSSATEEDLPGASFAGQQETFLNVSGEKALIESVHSCWISLWAERAFLYRIKNNIKQSDVKIAVVVQEMVPADTAGVMNWLLTLVRALAKL